MITEILHEELQKWEKHALIELQNEYQNILRSHRLKMRPVRLALVDSKTFWGQWVRETRTIFLSRELLLKHIWPHVVLVLRHEMAHQYVDEVESPRQREVAHGPTFQQACRKLGIPEYLIKASLNMDELDWHQHETDAESDKLLEKVRKLLNLATSSNEHESVLAMNKVRELYAKYNLESTSLQNKYVHSFIMTGKKRLTTPEQKIIGILVGHFFVQVIVGMTYSAQNGESERVIEIIGRKENVLMAEYVYHFLKQQSQALMSEAILKAQNSWSLAYRKAYHLGILQGFDEKLSVTEKTHGESLIAKALVVFRQDRELGRYISSVHPRLTSLSSRARLGSHDAYSEGKRVGREINLNKPITSKNSVMGRLLKGC